jgi:hypothetical protein
MNQDYYADAKKLADLLEKEGLFEHSKNILYAIEEGMTSTEILMALRRPINTCMSLGKGTKNTVTSAKILSHELNKALNVSARVQN